jgi:hypothetical protein
MLTSVLSNFTAFNPVVFAMILATAALVFSRRPAPVIAREGSGRKETHPVVRRPH